MKITTGRYIVIVLISEYLNAIVYLQPYMLVINHTYYLMERSRMQCIAVSTNIREIAQAIQQTGIAFHQIECLTGHDTTDDICTLRRMIAERMEWN